MMLLIMLCSKRSALTQGKPVQGQIRFPSRGLCPCGKAKCSTSGAVRKTRVGPASEAHAQLKVKSRPVLDSRPSPEGLPVTITARKTGRTLVCNYAGAEIGHRMRLQGGQGGKGGGERRPRPRRGRSERAWLARAQTDESVIRRRLARMSPRARPQEGRQMKNHTKLDGK